MELPRDSINATSRKYGLPADMVEALVIVESAGVPTWKARYHGRSGDYPVIRFEGHYFYKRLNNAQKKAAVAAGLASPKAGAIPNPKSGNGRYALLERAQRIDSEAALESISMGVGQVMGAHWKLLGFGSAQDMFDFACTGLVQQIELMCKFIASQPALKRAVQARDYVTVARMYNGPSYKKYAYDFKLQQASDGHAWYGSAEANRDAWTDTIKELGYDSVEAFQAERGLTVDGIAGPATIAEVKRTQDERKAADRTASGNKGKVVAGSAATVAIGGAVTDAVVNAGDTVTSARDATDLVSGIGTYGPAIAVALLAVIGIGAFAYFYLRSRNSD